MHISINTTFKRHSHHHISYKEYKDAGDYWNKYPKTDYTYSHMSPYRREVVPGVIAMPNMSRKSLKEPIRSNLLRSIASDHLRIVTYDCRNDFVSKNLQKCKADSQAQTVNLKNNAWIFYNIVFKKLINMFSSVIVLLSSKREPQRVYHSKIHESRHKNEMHLVQFLYLVRSFIVQLISIRLFYIIVSFFIYLDAALLRSPKQKEPIKQCFCLSVILLFPLIPFSAVRSTENQLISAYPVQSLIMLLIINAQKNGFLSYNTTILTHNLNCFWISTQSSNLFPQLKMKKRMQNSFMVDDFNETLHRLFYEILEECKEDFITIFSNKKISTSDLLNVKLGLTPLKTVSLLGRKKLNKCETTTNISQTPVNIISNSFAAAAKHKKNIDLIDTHPNVIRSNAKLINIENNSMRDRKLCFKNDKVCTLFPITWKSLNKDTIHKTEIQYVNPIHNADDFIVNQPEEIIKNSDSYENKRSLHIETPFLFSLLRKNLMFKFRAELRKMELFHQEKTMEQRIKYIVNEALETYDADKVGKVDYALESAGGQVISTRCTEAYSNPAGHISILGISLWSQSSSPRNAISPSVYPGQCWAFQSFPGFLVLKLNALIYVTGFTIEHIRKNLAPYGRIDSAPKDFSVWGLINEHDDLPTLFGQFQFLDNDMPRQYFAVSSNVKRRFDMVEIRVESNHGSELYTCLYRLRVHGTPYDSTKEPEN